MRCDLASARGWWVISDEIYRRISYGVVAHSVLELAAHRDNLVVINGSPEHPSIAHAPRARDLQPVQMTLAPGRALPVAGVRADRSLDSFRKQRVHAVAGIGNPRRFFADLRSRGLDIVEHAFPDHHPFTAADLDFGDAQPVLMTEKDAVKCRAFADARAWYVPVTAQFSDTHTGAILEAVVANLGRSVSEVVR